MAPNEISNDKENHLKKLGHTRKITALACTDIASAAFVRLVRTVSLSAFNTFGITFQNHSGDSIVSSILHLFQNLIQEL